MNDILTQLYQRLKMPDWTSFPGLAQGSPNNVHGEYFSGHSDDKPMTLEEIMRMKFPGLFEQYKNEDVYQPQPARPVSTDRQWRYL